MAFLSTPFLPSWVAPWMRADFNPFVGQVVDLQVHEEIQFPIFTGDSTDPYLSIMAAFPRFRFLAIAVIFHFVYIFSIFDIYFVSPIVTGMNLFHVERPASRPAPADRLVLFVGRSQEM